MSLNEVVKGLPYSENQKTKLLELIDESFLGVSSFLDMSVDELVAMKIPRAAVYEIKAVLKQQGNGSASTTPRANVDETPRQNDSVLTPVENVATPSSRLTTTPSDQSASSTPNAIDTMTLEEMRQMTKDWDPKYESHKHHMVDAVVHELIKVNNKSPVLKMICKTNHNIVSLHFSVMDLKVLSQFESSGPHSSLKFFLF